MKRNIFIMALFFVGTIVYADNVTFPVAELGNCNDKESCKTYCDTTGHENQCLDFAQKQGLMSSSEIAQAKKFIAETGPGGCKGNECKSYCNNGTHIDECTDFAVKKGFISQDDATRAKKFQKATEMGGPGGCQKESCKQYCATEANHDECFKFAQKNGLVPPEEVARFEQGQKIKEKIKTTGGPGGCKEEGQCRSYCGDAGHVEECIAFASASGGLSPEEARNKLQEFSKQIKQFDQLDQPNDNQISPDGKMNVPESDTARFEQFKKFEERFKNDQLNGQNFPQPPKDSQGQPMMPQFKNDTERQQFMKQNMTPQMQQQMQDQMKQMPQNMQKNMPEQMQKNDQDKIRMQQQQMTQQMQDQMRQMQQNPQQNMPQQMTPQMQQQMQQNSGMQNQAPSASQMQQMQQQMPQNMQQSMPNMPSMPQSNSNSGTPFSASILDAFHYLVR